MSGLILRFMVLVAAASMTGVTAFDAPDAPAPRSEPAPPDSAPTVSAPVASPPTSAAVPSTTSTVPDVRVDEGDVDEAPKPPDQTEATLVFGGDILIHSTLRSRASQGGNAYDFQPMFEPIRPFIAPADLAICHLEVPLTSSNTDLATYPRFNAPHEVAKAIAHAGFDGCSTASNHSIDKGVAV